MVYNLTIEESYADAIINGDRTFDMRYNDVGYQKGDRVVYRCVDGATNITVNHDINYKVYEITYLLHGLGLKENFCVFGIKEIVE